MGMTIVTIGYQNVNMEPHSRKEKRQATSTVFAPKKCCIVVVVVGSPLYLPTRALCFALFCLLMFLSSSQTSEGCLSFLERLLFVVVAIHMAVGRTSRGFSGVHTVHPLRRDVTSLSVSGGNGHRLVVVLLTVAVMVVVVFSFSLGAQRRTGK
jgi:hypothetical protein